MTEPPTRDAEGEGVRDWRIWFGLSLTGFWLALGFVYILGVIGWGRFVRQPAEALGGFLEGAFAPLAFLWLVIGFFLQQRELGENTKAIRAQHEQMRRTAEQAEIQAQALSANVLHQRQETFLAMVEVVRRQLGAVIGLLYLSSQGVPGEANVSNEEVGEMWQRLGEGDPEVFSRALIGIHFQRDREYTYDVFWGTPVRRRHSENVIRTFERLLRTARELDPDRIITDALLGSGHGTVYRLIVDYRDNPPEGPTS